MIIGVDFRELQTFQKITQLLRINYIDYISE